MPPAHRYFSDGFPTYAQLIYSGTHAVAPGKSKTFSVEGDNAELRHYLARLARKSRCFFAVPVGLDAGDGLVRVRLEPPSAGQAGVPEAPSGGV